MILVLLVLVTWIPVQSGAVRIETAEALEQLVKKVDPVVPPQAAAAKVGGAVIADVIVGADGSVRSVTILGGHEMLHAAATAALKQWQFKPFTRREKPVAVQVILEVAFPDPVRDQERRVFEDHRDAERECEKLSATDPAKAIEVCAEAARRSEALPADRILERAHTIEFYAASLMRAGRFSDAVTEVERMLALRNRATSGRPDAGTAGVHHVLAILHDRLGDTTKADAAFSTAVGMYEAAIASHPDMREAYQPGYQRALQGYAEFKRKGGDPAGAAALDARVGPLPPVAPPKALGASTRVIDGVEVVERGDTTLSDADIAAIRAALKQQGLRPWMLSHAGPSEHSSGGREWFVDAFLVPTFVSPELRRGEVEFVVRTSGRWAVQKLAAFYVQIGNEPPMKIQAAPNNPAPKDAAILEFVQFVRSQDDVKPWPIDFISFGVDGASVTLQGPESDRRQHVNVRREGSAWRVVDIR